jgi:hypothetical protein
MKYLPVVFEFNWRHFVAGLALAFFLFVIGGTAGAIMRVVDILTQHH